MTESVDSQVDRLRAARGSAAELKLRLVSLRSELPKGLIFVFEGDEDRGVYLSWNRQIGLPIEYEPFSCGGKRGVLALWRAVRRDLNGLGHSVYFFVDRDFDDLGGEDPDESIFVTLKYSIENYLVTAEVLDHVLKTEFHCHGYPAARSRVIELFNRLYDEYLGVTSVYNRDLHVARISRLELVEKLPKNVSRLAKVSVDRIEPSGVRSSEVVVVDPELSEVQRNHMRTSFDELEPRDRYRGKFALAFLRAWLVRLAEERRREGSDLFMGLDHHVKVPVDRLTLATLAARSDPPYELAVFLERVYASCRSAQAVEQVEPTSPGFE